MSDDDQLELVTRLRMGEWRTFPFTVVFAKTLPDRCADLAAADVDAAWLGDLTELIDEMPLLDSNDATGLGAPLLTAAAPPISLCDGEAAPVGTKLALQRRTTARGLAQLIGQLDRVIAWAGAHQAAAMAALGRPGVAVPVGDLLDAVTQGGSGGPIGAQSAAALRSGDFEADTWQQTSISGDPAWDDAAADQAMRIAAAEVGAQLAWSPSAARSRMCESLDIVDNLPLAHRLWAHGRLDRTRLTVLADRTQDLDPAARELVEEHLLADGGASLRSRTPARVRTLVDRCAAELDPDAVRRRQERARQDRDVYVSSQDDGMSRFCADVSTPVAVLARSVIDTVARGLSSERSIGQRRADVFADLFTRLAVDGHVDIRGGGGAPETAVPDGVLEDAAGEQFSAPVPPEWERVDSGVTVVIEASVLDGVDLTDTPAIEGALLGSHPALPADLVTALAVSATRARIAIRGITTAEGTTACASGCASARTNLTVGADVYRPSATLTEKVVLRDRVCRFPGCRHPARRCDLDHRVPFAQDGPTTAENLDALCRFHHRLKTFAGWRAIRGLGNRMIWTTPLGSRITDEPELAAPDAERVHPVPSGNHENQDPPPY